ncbi:Bug family tripartite tricarboxylate transporter substrate binding protein [Xylophilus sp.]|uniref:Bug family tripartite tricarboxylate transporter substrate binding protein n=1 Tax=Xylophilus sp. TaxID=2653893 RepID=UPI0013B6953E|nr:tripartite tricarboxylate transporter substrate binding protein [Xylophilus sp.]KAF1042263.1 MAG: hypothetical protein GAK38_04375 [Xylophilus sp.]
MPTLTKRSFLRSAAALPLLGAVPLTAARAEAPWPSRPITYIVPFSPGGATDLIGRLYAQAAGKSLGVPIVIDNRPGTGGSLGSAVAARAKPDGYTLVGGTISSHAINARIYPSIGYDPVASFQPLILTGTLPNVLVVKAGGVITSVDSLRALARQRSAPLTFGSSGVGSSQHLAGELFATTTGLKLLHVPYKGSAPSLQALLGGEIDLLFDNITSAQPFIESGRLAALAVTSSQPSSILPGVRPLSQLGVDGYEVVSWQATFAPAGTPRPVVERLYQALHAALTEPASRERLQALGLDVSGASPDELARFQKAEVAKWAAVVKKAGIKAE